ncbi:hypothetical protein LOTGIDRAFT_236049 [Lottia gigantea]|uniref:Small ribosomal subunit protein mS35 mitochondrial conserved domain-containing protein n=1 Tax=Lottia gigantea TaxID=225164 RepID=V3Z2H5_LOTGI|nr:hypothetical protein LOTGIDRAFT_236049 [Lottia gigantea]ESO84808.1 hypothetical protein LOTGIDRAFT_236049 [Lottia gigantea]
MSNSKSLIPLCNAVHQRILSVRSLVIPRKIRTYTESEEIEKKKPVGEFRVFEIDGVVPRRDGDRPKRTIREKEIPPPRYKSMPIDQDWTRVWPTAASFNYSKIPFPVRQGYVHKNENSVSIPERYANIELRKIPNFLHLTPAHVKKHCQAIKKFCTPWPKVLNTDEKCHKLFPITVKTREYCFSGSTLSDERARIVTLQVKLSALKLDYHGEDKIKRLLGERYNPVDDIITLTTNRCPLKKQNYDYAMYLLTACYYEANKTEPWELEKADEDLDKYYWDRSQSKHNIVQLLHKVHLTDQGKNILDDVESTNPDEEFTEECLKTSDVAAYSEAVTDLHNEGENIITINNYKNSVLNILNIRTDSKQ